MKTERMYNSMYDCKKENNKGEKERERILKQKQKHHATLASDTKFSHTFHRIRGYTAGTHNTAQTQR